MHQYSIKTKEIFHEIKFRVLVIDSYLRFYYDLTEDYNLITLLSYADFVVKESILIIQYEPTILVEYKVEGFCSTQSNAHHSNHYQEWNQSKALNLKDEILLPYYDSFLKA